MSVFTGVSAALGGAGRREAEEFARLLETGRVPPDHELADLVALARQLVPADPRPAPEFRAALRERLVTEAGQAALPAPRTAEPAEQPRRPRLRHAVAAVAVASVVAGAGAATASTRALPGDVLYGLKRQIENVQLALAGSDLERGRELLEQADSRLTEAERLADADDASEPETQRALGTALDEMREATEAGAAALTDSYQETGDEEPMLLLDRFVTDQQQRLEELYDLLDPSLRARVVALVDQLSRVGARASAVLASVASGRAAEELGPAAGDGWAMSRLADQVAVEAAGAGTGLPADVPGAADGAGAVGSTGTAGDGGAGGLLDDTVDRVTGGSTTGDGSGTSPGGPLPGATSNPLPSITSPLPDVTSPLPDVTSPLPDVTSPLPDVSEPLPSLPVPVPSVSACVPVPPLTSC